MANYTTHTFSLNDNRNFKIQMLNWANRFNIFCFLDSCGYAHANTPYDFMLAAGALKSIELNGSGAFTSLKEFHEEEPSWLFGHLGYEVNTDSISPTNGFGKGFFFEPAILIKVNGKSLTISGTGMAPKEILDEILATPKEDIVTKQRIVINPSISREEYIGRIEAIRRHIKRGDCYELNFCQEFYAEHATISPVEVFTKLGELSPNPFTALYRVNENYCLCASPERFLQKTGNELISQPIKGTSRRFTDAVEDANSKAYLLGSTKERSENVMVVDLVRNDLSKVCSRGSVEVSELFGIYSFPQVHQMISTVKGILREELHWTDAIEAAFPMGSMTGAPKKRVMELIAEFENQPRGLFSGSIGYVTPEGDFDLNVVIRSLFYNEDTHDLNFLAGGGITIYSDPVKEYEESCLKAAAIMQVLS